MPGSPTSWATEVFALNAFPGIAGSSYHWNDANQNGIVEPPEVDLSETALPGKRESRRPRARALPSIRSPPDLEPPETDEFIVGVERQLSTDLSVSLAYTHRRLTGPLFDR